MTSTPHHPLWTMVQWLEIHTQPDKIPDTTLLQQTQPPQPPTNPTTQQHRHTSCSTSQIPRPQCRLELRFNVHHQQAIKQARTRVTQLYRIAGNHSNKRASTATTLKIYKIMIHPVIDYATLALVHISNKNLQDTEKLQCRAARIALQLHYTQHNDNILN